MFRQDFVDVCIDAMLLSLGRRRFAVRSRVLAQSARNEAVTLALPAYRSRGGAPAMKLPSNSA